MEVSLSTRAGLQSPSMPVHSFSVSSGTHLRAPRVPRSLPSLLSRPQRASPHRQACGPIKSSPSNDTEGATASESLEKQQAEQAQPVSSSGKEEDRSLRRARSSRKEEEDGQFRIDQLNPYSMGRKSRCDAWLNDMRLRFRRQRWKGLHPLRLKAW